jgi:hypothetical protein
LQKERDFLFPILLEKEHRLCQETKDDIQNFAFTYKRTRSSIGRDIFGFFRALEINKRQKRGKIVDKETAGLLLASLEPLVEAYFSIPLEFEDFIRPRILDRSYEKPDSCQKLHPKTQQFQQEAIKRFAALGLKPLITIPIVNFLYGVADFEKYDDTLQQYIVRIWNRMSSYAPLLENDLTVLAPTPFVSLGIRLSESVCSFPNGGEEQTGSLYLSSRVSLPVTLSISNDDILASVRKTFPWAEKLWEMEGYGGPYIWGRTAPGPMLDYWLNDVFDLFFEYACFGGMPVVTSLASNGLDTAIPDLVLRAWSKRCGEALGSFDEVEGSYLPDFRWAEEVRLTDFILNNEKLTSDLGKYKTDVNTALCKSGISNDDRKEEISKRQKQLEPALSELRSKLVQNGLVREGENIKSTSLTAVGKVPFNGLTPSLIRCIGLHAEEETLSQMLRFYARISQGVEINPSYGASLRNK